MLLSAAAASVVAACAPVPNLGARPEVRAADSYVASQSFAAAAPSQWPATNWWAAYNDPQLNALMEEAFRGAPNLAAAAARLRAAQAYAVQAGAAGLPRVDASGSAAANQINTGNGLPIKIPSDVQTIGYGTLNLGFDLDLWGKNRAQLAAATSEAEAARLELEQARLALSTNIAAAYADLARLAADRQVQERALQVRLETQKLVTDRVTNGLETRAEEKQAAAAVPAERAQLAGIDEQIGLTRNRLAALLGQGPDRGLSIALPTAPTEARGLPADVTTDLIGRRPDIAAARARVEAAASKIKVARAAFYPSIRLSALAGYGALGLDNLVKGNGASVFQAGPAISLPIFHGGELRGQYAGARAAYDEAVANYDNSVTTAYHDVADAVTSQKALATRLSESRQALADSEQAYAIARQRYEGGLSRFLDVLTAEERVLQNRQIVAELEARAFALDVQLVRALGGGFSTNNAATAASEVPTHG
ncbi:efflux transporter outer membrane subunit [Sphingomonas pokkalii]|uniref:efflux transporter outer membrane subunit n=1 Tax=Sphingomonas pokkalii TaxID=2175090 RepID=UPI001F0C46DA|nr:efflux transporter outer membrane subunit [Sphingomonas pokkalii]